MSLNCFFLITLKVFEMFEDSGLVNWVELLCLDYMCSVVMCHAAVTALICGVTDLLTFGILKQVW